ncbi:MAG: 30S ribosomal protein S3 [Kiritimatiellae bacterium]|nr:30S ribosomal protein S3 [Kiritimatiellia bacterium]
MGQKVNPIGFRVAVDKQWRSRWFATKKQFGELLAEDQMIRDLVKKRLESAAITKILIERYANRVRVNLFTARPGVVVGRKGQDVDKIRQELAKLTGKEIYIEIREVRDPDANAQLVAENIAQQIERLVAMKRDIKRADKVGMDLGV